MTHARKSVIITVCIGCNLRSEFFEVCRASSNIRRRLCLTPLKTYVLRLSDIKAIEVHHFIPGRYKVLHKLLL